MLTPIPDSLAWTSVLNFAPQGLTQRPLVADLTLRSVASADSSGPTCIMYMNPYSKMALGILVRSQFCHRRRLSTALSSQRLSLALKCLRLERNAGAFHLCRGAGRVHACIAVRKGPLLACCVAFWSACRV
jgi:hypothetical protein